MDLCTRCGCLDNCTDDIYYCLDLDNQCCDDKETILEENRNLCHCVEAADGEKIRRREGWWFILSGRAGDHTNLHFENIVVKQYQNGINFFGNRNNPVTGWNGNNAVVGCKLEDLGDASIADMIGHGTAGVDLVNSRYNFIVGNEFRNLVNDEPNDFILIHGVYMAHYSHHNYVFHNTFNRVSGAPIQIRDFSNHNVIEQNLFAKAGARNEPYAYKDWYCNPEERPDCTKYRPECPSFNNTFRNNILSCAYGYIGYPGDCQATAGIPNYYEEWCCDEFVEWEDGMDIDGDGDVDNDDRKGGLCILPNPHLTPRFTCNSNVTGNPLCYCSGMTYDQCYNEVCGQYNPWQCSW